VEIGGYAMGYQRSPGAQVFRNFKRRKASDAPELRQHRLVVIDG